MPERHLLVTPLPNGRQGNTGFLSVALTPRLRERGVLGDYPDVRDWANVAGVISAQVLLDGVPLPPAQVTRVSPAPVTRAWRALFGQPASSVMPVDAAGYVDRSTATFTTMDSGALARLSADLYRAVAAAGPGGLSREQVDELFDPIAGGPLPIAEGFFAPIGNGEEPTAPEHEFHATLRHLQAHPYLLRILGLVVDLEIVLPAVPPAEVQVRTDWATTTGAAARDEVPLRMLVDEEFEPVVGEPTYRRRRWLTLGDINYGVVQGSAPNTAAMLQEVRRALARADSADAVSVPALDDGGLSVVTLDHVARMQRAFARQRAVEDGIDAFVQNLEPLPPQIRAEDVQVGYRIDVEDVAAPTFRPLYGRTTVGYEFPRDPAFVVAPPDDESWASTAVLTDGTPVLASRTNGVRYGESQVRKGEWNDTTHWRVDDHLVTWSGWSMAVGRPARPLDRAGNVVDDPVNEPQSTDVAQVIVDYAVPPGTLPRLRYEHTYRFQARCVDLAGNSPAIADPKPAEAVSPDITFGRTVPVPAPLVVRRASRVDPGRGDDMFTMVIKSNNGQADADTKITHRCVFPPSIAQGRLEQHGLPAGGIDPASYTMLAARDAVRLADQCLVDPETGELVAGAAVQGGAVTEGPLLQDVAYLADPVARGAAFTSVPGTGGTVEVPFGGWPGGRSVTVELRAGDPTTAVDTTNQQITFTLPKGTTQRVQLSSALDPALVPHFTWFQELAPPDRSRLLGDITAGLVGLFSPPQELRLVHAVRQPLAPPSFPPDAASASRTEVGQTTTVLAGTVENHGGTSEHLAIRATWVDPIDDVTQPAPSTATRRGVVGTVTCNGSGTDALDGLVLDLRDTRRHVVDIDAEAFCSYSKYFVDRRQTTATQGAPITLSTNGVSADTVSVADRTTDQLYSPVADYVLDATAGTVTPVVGGGIATGTRLRIEYLRRPYSRRSAESPTGKKARFEVPASARPAPPDVDHVLPAFKRRITSTANVITVDHDGRVLRVFLKRPWYSSGSGELLGVACDGDNPRGPYTTLGRDPTEPGTGPYFGPFVTAFSRMTTGARSVDGRFDVAGHAVVFDPARDLWTSDVVVDHGSGYRPLLGLVLCRYQPLAIDGEHVSELVNVDPLRLGADRRVRVTRGVDGRVTVRVTGPDMVNRMQVTVQVADPAISDPELHWVDAGAPVSLNRSGTTEASVHVRSVTLPSSSTPRRLLVEDREPVRVEQSGVLVTEYVTAYRETVEIPTDW